MGEVRNTQKILVKNLKVRSCFEHLDIVARLIFFKYLRNMV